MKTNLIITGLLIITLNSQSQIEFDLSDKKKSTETIELSSNSFILFKNLTYKGVDENQYDFTVDMEEEEIPPIPSVLEKQGDACSCLSAEDMKTKKKFINLQDESKVPLELDKLKKISKSLDPKNQNQSACIDYIHSLISMTTYQFKLQFDIKNNQTIKITVVRKYKLYDLDGKPKSDTSATWVKIFKTPRKSPWQIMYGFTYFPNAMNPVTNYYSRADTSGKSFTISSFNNQSNTFWKNISPTFMVTWKPTVKHDWKKGEIWGSLFSNNFYQLGFTGGLSLNFSSNTGIANVMAGPSLIIADNFSLSGGVAFVQKNVLKGQYADGQIIKENLDFGSLHELQWMCEWFVSLAFRFDGNPFTKADDKSK